MGIYCEFPWLSDCKKKNLIAFRFSIYLLPAYIYHKFAAGIRLFSSADHICYLYFKLTQPTLEQTYSSNLACMYTQVELVKQQDSAVTTLY